MFNQRFLLRVTFVSAALLGGLAIVWSPLLLFGPSRPHDPLNSVRLLTGTAACGMAMAWTLFFTLRAYHQLDEFQQDRSKNSWYFGSLIGLTLSAPPFFFIAAGGLHWVDHQIPSGIHLLRAFLIGYFLPVICMAIGFYVVRFWPRAASQ